MWEKAMREEQLDWSQSKVFLVFFDDMLDTQLRTDVYCT